MLFLNIVTLKTNVHTTYLQIVLISTALPVMIRRTYILLTYTYVHLPTYLKFQVTLLVLCSSHLAFGAGGPQRHKADYTRLAVLRSRFLKSQEGQQESEQVSQGREGRNLASVFPFVGGNRGLPRARLFGEEPVDIHDDHHHHHEHHDHHEEHQDFDSRISR